MCEREREVERERESKTMWCLHSISSFDVYSRLSVFEISDAASASALWNRYRWRDGFGLWEREREIEIERGGEMEWEGEMEGWMDKGVYQGSE